MIIFSLELWNFVDYDWNGSLELENIVLFPFQKKVMVTNADVNGIEINVSVLIPAILENVGYTLRKVCFTVKRQTLTI